MVVVRGHRAPRALLLLMAVASCRGESRAPAPPPLPPPDEPLAWPAIDEAALDALAATRGFALGVPVPLAITPDGAVLFRRTKPREPGADLYQLDAAGKVTVVATAAALLGGAPADAALAVDGITTIDVSRDGARVLVPLAGRLFAIERATGAARELAIGAHRDPSLSPDGSRVAFVRDGDLWLATVEHGQPVRLTQHPADREYATPEAVAADFGRDRGYWWAPDGQSIAFQRSDARGVDTLYLGDARRPEQAPAAVKLPRSGRANAIVDLGIVSIRGGAPRWVTWELARYPYLARVSWPAHGPLSLIVVGRDQTQLAVLAADPAAGATRQLLVESDPAWLNVAPTALTWLDDGSGFLWMTERSGAWSLEHRGADGALVREVVTADAGLRRVVGVGADGRDVIIEAANDAREHHVRRVALASGESVAMTSDGGLHHAIAGHGVVVIASALRAGGRSAAIVRADGSRVELPSVAERAAQPPTTKFETFTFDAHAQFTAYTRPRAYDPRVRYPVLLRVGGEPDTKLVLDALDTYAQDQWYADAGFIVIRSDGRGTPDRDRSWQRVISGDVFTIPMNDQIGVLKKFAKRHLEVDLARVGVSGAGFGGYLATMGVLTHPDVFAAGVAVSPIIDWELLGTAYGERYMKTPATNPDGYRRANAATYAEQLTRPLLLIHDVTAARVPFAHTLRLIDAVSAAGKRVELATLPATGDAKLEIARARLEIEFLRARLGPPVRTSKPAAQPVPSASEQARSVASPGTEQDRGSDHR